MAPSTALMPPPAEGGNRLTLSPARNGVSFSVAVSFTAAALTNPSGIPSRRARVSTVEPGGKSTGNGAGNAPDKSDGR
jgi:hypothetical protein